jgi:hypothetical protein
VSGGLAIWNSLTPQRIVWRGPPLRAARRQTAAARRRRYARAERAALAEPARHQVVELPPTAVILSEHRLQRLRCPDCGAATRAKLPPEAPAGAFGPRLWSAPLRCRRHAGGEKPHLAP